MPEIIQIPIEKLTTGVHDIRMEVENEDLDELAASIRRIGIIVPLVVVAAEDRFTVVAGHRRLSAARKVGLQTVPCVVRSGSVADSTEVSLAENIFRTDLTPIEQAAAMADILREKIMDVTALAAAMHRSEHWVHAQLAILGWPADVLEVIHRGKISVSAASNLAMVNDDAYRSFLLRNAEDSGATARTTAAWLQAWRAALPQEQALEQPPVEGLGAVTPALPQAPCIVCSQMFRTDGLAMVMVCSGCVNAIRGASG